MCTVSWSVGQGRLSLVFNRDERKTRPAAEGPRTFGLGSLRAIAAIDPQGGGTWLSVNEAGWCIFLLNNYAAGSGSSPSPAQLKSRGALPLELASISEEEWRKTIEGPSSFFAPFEPFYLGFAGTEGVEAYSWDGRSFEAVSVAEGLLTTSSYRSCEVQSYRLARFKELSLDACSQDLEARRAFHTEVAHDDAAFNPMMLREDARTQSLVSVVVDENGVDFRYEEVQGETRELGSPMRLHLERAS